MKQNDKIDSNFPEDASELAADPSRRQLVRGASILAGLAAFAGAKQIAAQTAPAPPSQTTDAGRFLQGQVAIVTGAARGIGQAIALALANAGANIVAVDIAQGLPLLQYNLSSFSDLINTAGAIQATGAKCLPIPADVRDDNMMQNVAQQAISNYGRVDILVANAGVQIYNVPLAQTTSDQWRLIIDTNLTGAANSMRAILPYFVQQSAGNIIAITSVEGRMGDKNSASYSASKWGLIGLVKSLALEVGQYNIRVNGISPATVATPLTMNQASYQSTNPQNPTLAGFTQANLAENALPYPYLLPQDIADAALFLTSPAARFVTGAAFDISLGRNAHYTA